MITIHIEGWMWLLVVLTSWLWLFTAVVVGAINARKAHWEKELKKTIAQNVAKGIPTKVFVKDSVAPS